MKKTRFVKPYHWDSKKTTFPERKRAGVYFIKRIGGVIEYIGMSETDVYKAMYHHFQTWNDKQSQRKTYNRETHSVRVIYCTFKQAARLERAMILKLKPRDNDNKFLSYTLTPSDENLLKNAFGAMLVSAPF